MNTWFRRAVGTVGVAGGILLLGAGAAHADDTALAPGQQVPDLLSTLLPTNSLGLPSTDALQGTSIADSRTAFPRVPSPRKATAATEGLPVVGGLPVLGGGFPVHGTLKPIDDFGIPLSEGTQATEAGGLPVVGDVPIGGSDVLKDDSVTGLPVIGGVGPTSGVNTTAVANRLVPTTGALPQAADRLPLVAEKAYAPKHSTMYSAKHAEALPVVGSLPLVGGRTAAALPLLGS